MTVEQHSWSQLRNDAQAFLPTDFARQVVRRAQNQPKTARREYVLIVITAGVCIFFAVAANWYWGNRIQNKNLALWDVAVAQINALRTSI
jgi:hypothetical protein